MTTNAYDFLVVTNVVQNSFLAIDNIEFEDPETPFIILESEDPSPEELAIKSDLREKLSDEAKMVLDTILSSPAEISEMMSIVGGDYKFKLGKYLRRKFGKRNLVKDIVNELENYTKEIASI